MNTKDINVFIILYYMEFSVNDTTFTGEITFDNTLSILSLKHDYNVEYSNDDLTNIVNMLYHDGDIIFIDRNVYNLQPESFKDKLANTYIFDATEETKNMSSVLEFTDMLYDNKFTRQNKVIVIGGGISEEVGGFASAIYKRGVNWVFVPTTILSMTDSCIGSKVSINTKSKNMLGLFVAPNRIIISDYFLESLHPDDIISGVGEALKLSLIGGEKTYELFKNAWNKKNYMNMIKLASLVKKQVIELDEFEKNERKVLNYGHTIGHAIESTTNYTIPHGIAVLIGMYVKNKLFHPESGLHTEINELILEMVDKKFFSKNINYELFINHVLSDKKNRGENICFIDLDDIGKSKFIYIHINKIKDTLINTMKNIFNTY